jgi:hypothetical protein
MAVARPVNAPIAGRSFQFGRASAPSRAERPVLGGLPLIHELFSFGASGMNQSALSGKSPALTDLQRRSGCRIPKLS